MDVQTCTIKHIWLQLPQQQEKKRNLGDDLGISSWGSSQAQASGRWRSVNVKNAVSCCLLRKKAIILCRSSKAAAATAAAAIFYLSSQDLDASELRAAFRTWVQRLTSLNQVSFFFLFSFFYWWSLTICCRHIRASWSDPFRWGLHENCISCCLEAANSKIFTCLSYEATEAWWDGAGDQRPFALLDCQAESQTGSQTWKLRVGVLPGRPRLMQTRCDTLRPASLTEQRDECSRLSANICYSVAAWSGTMKITDLRDASESTHRSLTRTIRASGPRVSLQPRHAPTYAAF